MLLHHLAIAVQAIIICRVTIETYHDGCEITMFSVYLCFVQLLVRYILVLVLRSLTLPVKCSFAKQHWQYEPLTSVAHHSEADSANFPFLRNVI